jgi:hypothetical protein
MPLTDRGFFIWMIPRCEGGDPYAIADLAQQARYDHVLIKIADTAYSYNIWDGVDLVPPVVRALQDRKIQAWGWHYVKGDNPIGEANKAIERVERLGLDGYVIDAESEYKQPGKAAAALKFMERLRSALPYTPVALSSYRYPSYHPQLPWREFLEGCDYNMPQVYWMKATNAGAQLERSVREFSSMTPFRPIIPTGAAFKEWGWKPAVSEVLEFLHTAKSLNLAAVNFYSWDSARAYLPDIWDAIAAYPWPSPGALSDPASQFVAALNTRNPDQVLNLYNPNAVHITAARTIQGLSALRTWYQSLFTQLLPNATFLISSLQGTGPSRHFSWTATSDRGRVLNGRDTLGLINDRIVYHYSFFSITP